MFIQIFTSLNLLSRRFIIFFSGAPAPTTCCQILQVSAKGRPSRAQFGKFGTYYSQFDDTHQKIYWRMGREALWAVGQYWYIGSLRNRFQMAVSMHGFQIILHKSLRAIILLGRDKSIVFWRICVPKYYGTQLAIFSRERMDKR